MNKVLINQIATIIIWIVGFILWAVKGWWYLAAAILVSHLVEMLVFGIRIGREHGKSAGFSAIMSLIFGFTWWKPLRDNH